MNCKTGVFRPVFGRDQTIVVIFVLTSLSCYATSFINPPSDTQGFGEWFLENDCGTAENFFFSFIPQKAKSYRVNEHPSDCIQIDVVTSDYEIDWGDVSIDSNWEYCGGIYAVNCVCPVGKKYVDSYDECFNNTGTNAGPSPGGSTSTTIPKKITRIETDAERDRRVMLEMDFCIQLNVGMLQVMCSESPSLCDDDADQFYAANKYSDVLTRDYSSVLELADLSCPESDYQCKPRYGETHKESNLACKVTKVNSIKIDMEALRDNSTKLAEVLIHERLHTRNWPGACWRGKVDVVQEETRVDILARDIQSQLEMSTGVDWNSCVNWSNQEIR